MPYDDTAVRHLALLGRQIVFVAECRGLELSKFVSDMVVQVRSLFALKRLYGFVEPLIVDGERKFAQPCGQCGAWALCLEAVV